MKFKNQYTGKEYDDIKECEDSEKAYLEEQKNRKAKEEESKLITSKRKKELADKIELAEKAKDEALKKYDTAKLKAKEIITKAQKEADEVLREALKEVSNASEDKMNALSLFTKEFGPYNVSYTGNKATEEFNRWLKELASFNDWFWRI